jgi:hypothetical protein
VDSESFHSNTYLGFLFFIECQQVEDAPELYGQRINMGKGRGVVSPLGTPKRSGREDLRFRHPRDLRCF